MLRQASVQQLRAGSFSRKTGHVAICMCFYPRNLPKTLRDEYLAALAPDRALFKEWQAAAERAGHDGAFKEVDYEARFALPPTAMDELARLAKISEEKNVFLVCQCATGEKCHREILLLTAREAFGAQVGNIYHAYPTFAARIPRILAEWKASSGSPYR